MRIFRHLFLYLLCFVLSIYFLFSYISAFLIVSFPLFLIFSQALPNGQDDIEAVRLVRDPETLIGKGIGYILFKDRDVVLQALSLHEVK